MPKSTRQVAAPVEWDSVKEQMDAPFGIRHNCTRTALADAVMSVVLVLLKRTERAMVPDGMSLATVDIAVAVLVVVI